MAPANGPISQWTQSMEIPQACKQLTVYQYYHDWPGLQNDWPLWLQGKLAASATERLAPRLAVRTHSIQYIPHLTAYRFTTPQIISIHSNSHHRKLHKTLLMGSLQHNEFFFQTIPICYTPKGKHILMYCTVYSCHSSHASRNCQ